MEMYNISGIGNSDPYLIEGAELYSHMTSPNLERSDVMYNEGGSDFFVDQNLYYPAATNYGCYCTGFESPSDQEDHRRIFGVDGPDVQFMGAQNQNMPLVYYTPSYGYAQSPYNPYNPYIPGAMIGVDGPFMRAQQYYTIPPYQNPVSSPTYVPLVFQPDIIPNNASDSLFDTNATISQTDGRVLKQNLNPASSTYSRNSSKPVSNQPSSLARVSEGPRANAGGKQPMTHGSVSDAGFLNLASSHVLKGRSVAGSISAVDNISDGNKSKVALPNNEFSDFGPSAHGPSAIKVGSKNHVGNAINDRTGSRDALDEQNRGPRISRSKNQLAVKAYTTKAGDTNAQGNIIISTDQYNRDDFLVDYPDAKFFVIKSYSEDDVHKSIKYNVWSSTPHGNKKLDGAYEDAQMIAAGRARGCPVFLFFSVNASGQFCGVAEMVGAVDFNKDMDFWQQDKWTGSFPVKWHIIKDVPNTNLRHIILENNENKPVTNSRDTQEILYKKGLEMLKLFKSHTLKTSLLDDFMYYEERQKLMQEEKAKLLIRSIEGPFFISALDPPHKLNFVVDAPANKSNKNVEHDISSNVDLKQTLFPSPEPIPSNSDATDTSFRDKNTQKIVEEDMSSTIKIGALTINPKQVKSKTAATSSIRVANTESANVFRVGTIPVRVNGFSESSGFLKVGAIPLDLKALQQLKTEKGGTLRDGSQ